MAGMVRDYVQMLGHAQSNLSANNLSQVWMHTRLMSTLTESAITKERMNQELSVDTVDESMLFHFTWHYHEGGQRFGHFPREGARSFLTNFVLEFRVESDPAGLDSQDGCQHSGLLFHQQGGKSVLDIYWVLLDKGVHRMPMHPTKAPPSHAMRIPMHLLISDITIRRQTCSDPSPSGQLTSLLY